MKKFRCCFIDPQLGEHDAVEIMAEDYVLAKMSFLEKNAFNSLSFSCPKISTHDLETDEIIEFDNTDFGKTPSHGSEPRYPALRIIATVYRVLAVIFGITGVLVLGIGIAEEDMVLLLSGLLGGPLGIITSLAAAEGIIVFLDIEENTRRVSEK